MPVKFTFKSSIIILFCVFVIAAGIAFLLYFFLEGPKLGRHYDFLLGFRNPPPVSQEILIIDTDEFVENSDIFMVLMTLTEMEAANLILTSRVPISASTVIAGEAEIRRQFIEEYVLLGANIRNLFEAIRAGSITPAQAPAFVERLVELTEQGRDRLLVMLIEGDEDLLRSIAVFGNYFEVNIKPALDKDGKLRRVQPVDPESSLEHPVFINLKHRYAVSQVQIKDTGNFLYLRGYDGKELNIPLDNDGNIITPWNCGFNRVNIALFKEYEEAQTSMRYALEIARDAGVFSKTLPEKSPLYLDEYAFVLREEMLKNPSAENRDAWLNARADYMYSFNEILFSRIESDLLNEYDELIASLLLTEESSAEEEAVEKDTIAVLIHMRDELKHGFASLRDE
ncbi:MAG: hypothetical protein LBU66_00990, partial [Treponema sp.]|nr:hypothetical protein [Treponema sp.]